MHCHLAERGLFTRPTATGRPGPAPAPPCAPSGGQAGDGATPTPQCSLDFWPTSFFPAGSLWELTFQHCALLLPRQSSAGAGPGGEPGRRGAGPRKASGVQAASGWRGRLRVPGEVAVPSLHPRAPGGPDGLHVPPTGADNIATEPRAEAAAARGRGRVRAAAAGCCAGSGAP